MTDLDHFKLINDTQGHEAGDTALKMFTELLRNHIRREDVVARYGGEEFVLLLPGLDAARAVEVLERFRILLADATLLHPPAFTASFGVTDTRQPDSLAGLIRRADAALYQAKAQGRDCIVVDEGGSRPNQPARERVADAARHVRTTIQAYTSRDFPSSFTLKGPPVKRADVVRSWIRVGRTRRRTQQVHLRLTDPSRPDPGAKEVCATSIVSWSAPIDGLDDLGVELRSRRASELGDRARSGFCSARGGRSAVMASKASQTEMIRAIRGMSSPARAVGVAACRRGVRGWPGRAWRRRPTPGPRR